MRKIRVFSILAMVLLLAGFTLGPAQSPPVQAAGTAREYVLYATDGYSVEPDGNVIYMYGYVGGKKGDTITYLNVAGPGGDANFKRPMFPGDGLPDGWSVSTAKFNLGAPTPGATGPEDALRGHAQFMGPTIYAGVGDTVRIYFKNLGVANTKYAPNDPHTIHLHGLDVAAANDGVPETSVAAIPSNAPNAGAGNVIVYEFSPDTAGTYMYHCHQEADIHVQMGMIGTIVIYNQFDPALRNGGPGKNNGGGLLFGQYYDRDYILMESEIDVRQHWSEELNLCTPGADGPQPDCNNVLAAADPAVAALINAGGFNPVDYKPQYWQLNGLSFPNTIHVGLSSTGGQFTWANWSAAHPNDDPYIQGSLHGGHNFGGSQRILMRMINLGFETQPMHIHGYHPKLLGMDQRAWTWGINPITGRGLELNTFTLGSGNTMDVLFDIGAQQLTSTYPGGTQTRQNGGVPAANTSGAPAIPVPDPQKLDPTLFPNETYIDGPKATGLTVTNLNGAQLFPFHNHDDYKATNNGSYPGGMFTFVQPQP